MEKRAEGIRLEIPPVTGLRCRFLHSALLLLDNRAGEKPRAFLSI
jgi:hypothetical protein